MDMQTVSVASLKAKISYYLRQVQAGSEVLITSHHHPVGKLVPSTEQTEMPIRSPLRPTSTLARIRGISLCQPVDVVSLLRSGRDNDKRYSIHDLLSIAS